MTGFPLSPAMAVPADAAPTPTGETASLSRPMVLTVIEVARELRCSKAHVHNLILGKVQGVTPLPAMLLGRRRLVRRASLNAWMETNERGA